VRKAPAGGREDRRGAPRQVLRRGLPARAAVRQGPREDRQAAPGGRYDGAPVRPVRSRRKRVAAMATSGALRYRRVLLKLSGEALMGSASFGIDPEVVRILSDE